MAIRQANSCLFCCSSSQLLENISLYLGIPEPTGTVLARADCRAHPCCCSDTRCPFGFAPSKRLCVQSLLMGLHRDGTSQQGFPENCPGPKSACAAGAPVAKPPSRVHAFHGRGKVREKGKGKVSLRPFWGW